MSISLFSLNMKAGHYLCVLCVLFIAASLVDLSHAGPIAAGSTIAYCYSLCNVSYVSCLAYYGIVAGTTGPIGWWAWIVAAPTWCSGLQGACMSGCTVVGTAAAMAPTP